MFETLKRKNLVFIRRHPTLPLTILTYTPKAKFERKWTRELLLARGLVVDDEGNVVGRPLSKFFNDFEIQGNLPNGPIEVFEKMDGSLIVMFFYNGEPIFSTKGNFSSEQAQKAKEIFERKYKHLKLDQEFTYCFEVIYPENKIIVDYKEEEDLFLLAKIHTKTGKEESIDESGFKTAKLFAKMENIDKLKELKSLDKENEEGFVVKFSNGFRVKLKFETYFKLHNALNGYSDSQIWDFLSKGADIPCQHLSEDGRKEVQKAKEEFLSKFEAKKEELRIEYETIRKRSSDSKEIIDDIKRSKHPGALFCIDKGKDCDPIIWRILKPRTS